ncbi:MAG: radical SAM protein [Arenicellales bacterium]|nr:radical SAM protein [Arenicellales bacterium]MDP6854536.1 radical SAM protein [Arenicellales bacterium]
MKCILVDLLSAPLGLPTRRPATASLALQMLSAYSQRSGFQSVIVDAYSSGLSVEETAKKISSVKGPKLLGFAVMSSHVVSRIESVLTLLDLHACDIQHVTLGGYFATFNQDFLLQRLGKVNSVMRFEVDQVFAQLVSAVAEGYDWKELPGIAYREDGKVTVSAGITYPRNLDELPLADRSFERLDTNEVYIQTSRGCYGKCTFCLNIMFSNQEGMPNWRFRSAESVVDEIAHLAKDRGIRKYNIVDENFLGGRQKDARWRAHRIADLLIKNNLNIKFSISCRANDIDSDLLAHLRDAGLFSILLGIESGSSGFLRSIKKGTTVDTNTAAIKMVREAGISLSLGFMPYRPGTTLDSLDAEFRFLDSHVRGARLSPGLSQQLRGQLWVYEGSPEYHALNQKGVRMQRDANTRNMFRYAECSDVVTFRKVNNTLLEMIEAAATEIANLQIPHTRRMAYQRALDDLALDSSLGNLAAFHRHSKMDQSAFIKHARHPLVGEVSDVHSLAQIENLLERHGDSNGD